MLKERTHEIHRLKMTLERAIKAHMDEISSLGEQRNRLMRAMSVLEMPESIGKFSFYCVFRLSNKFIFQQQNVLSEEIADLKVNWYEIVLKKSS